MNRPYRSPVPEDEARATRLHEALFDAAAAISAWSTLIFHAARTGEDIEPDVSRLIAESLSDLAFVMHRDLERLAPLVGFRDTAAPAQRQQ